MLADRCIRSLSVAVIVCSIYIQCLHFYVMSSQIFGDNYSTVCILIRLITHECCKYVEQCNTILLYLHELECLLQ
jgi:hypothetical protein